MEYADDDHDSTFHLPSIFRKQITDAESGEPIFVSKQKWKWKSGESDEVILDGGSAIVSDLLVRESGSLNYYSKMMEVNNDTNTKELNTSINVEFNPPSDNQKDQVCYSHHSLDEGVDILLYELFM